MTNLAPAKSRSADPEAPPVRVVVTTARRLPGRLADLRSLVSAGSPSALSRDPAWLLVLKESFGHEVYALEASRHGRLVGFLPLAYVESLLFGRYLVSLPYLNSNGVVGDDPAARDALLTRAVELAGELDVKHLELRQESVVVHPDLDGIMTQKVHMRLPLPGDADALWAGYDPKVRNQVRKAQRHDLTTVWGGTELVGEFYRVLAENMRDLGTPVYGVTLFERILAHFPADAELAVVRLDRAPVAAALLLHGRGVTEVPTASSLRAYNGLCVNMLLYHELLTRSVTRNQSQFDFGRSTIDGPTYRFKKQWGARPTPAVWQYALGGNAPSGVRPDDPKYRRLIRLWQRLPVWLTRAVGPAIVRGIP